MSGAPIQAWLESVLAQAQARAGSVHEERDGDLHLVPSHAIPEPVLERIRHVARGKGMAGLAQVQRQPVQTCNLQTDDTGRIRPMARMVGGGAAVGIPVFRADGSLQAVVGFSFEEEGELPADRVRALEALARTLP